MNQPAVRRSPAQKQEPDHPIAEHQLIAILQLLQQPRPASEVEVYVQARWQPLSTGGARNWITELESAGLIELTESRGYVLTQAGRDELERLVPTPKPEEIEGISEEQIQGILRRVRAELGWQR